MLDLDAVEWRNELQVLAMLLGVLALTFYVGLILGAKTIAVGEPVWPPKMLPNLLWTGGQATGLFVRVYELTLSALWISVVGIVVTTALQVVPRPDHSDSADATEAD